jgi:hypothetical protein
VEGITITVEAVLLAAILVEGITITAEAVLLAAILVEDITTIIMENITTIIMKVVLPAATLAEGIIITTIAIAIMIVDHYDQWAVLGLGCHSGVSDALMASIAPIIIVIVVAAAHFSSWLPFSCLYCRCPISGCS